jgi:Skp family chaperone for outer membrane proteins
MSLNDSGRRQALPAIACILALALGLTSAGAAGPGVLTYASWDKATAGVEKAEAHWKSALNHYQTAKSAYRSVEDSADADPDSRAKAARLRSERDTKCLQALGEHGQWNEALSAAGRFVEKDIAAKEQALNTAAPAAKDAAAKSLAAAKTYKAWVSKAGERARSNYVTCL